MSRNIEDIEVRGFNPKDAIAIMGCSELQASINQNAGEARSYFYQGKLVACGGVREYGVGEPWLIIDAETARKNATLLIRALRDQMDAIVRQQKLWRMFAETKTNGTLLKHLGFEEKPAFFWQMDS